MIRILVVEDFEPFRRFICSTLRKRPELQIVGEVSDGLEAVQKSEELQPDLIVLDIGLPSLNGIEAARRIRILSPKSKILFVSQESSADMVQEALALGAAEALHDRDRQLGRRRRRQLQVRQRRVAERRLDALQQQCQRR